MRIIDMLVLLLAAPIVFAYLCRLRLLDVRLHRLSVVAMHLALFGSAFGAGVNAARGQADAQEVLSLLASGMWIIVSLSTWRHGVPDHALRRQG